mgnify:CR=1 FL=1
MITPLDIENKRFAKQMVNGYSVEEVDDFLDELTIDYSKNYKEVTELRAKVDELNSSLEQYKNIESTLQNTLVMAQTTAEEVKNVAKQKADQIVDEAKANAQKKVDELNNEIVIRQKELDDEVGRKMWKMVRQKCLDCRQQKKHVYIPYWLSVAAVALVLLLGATWMYFSGNKVNGAKDAFVEVVSKEGRLYMLPDSSRVWMHPGSSIRYPENFVQNRKVWLKGNSHFDVYKQDGKHFIVYIDRAFVEVKGTSFLINQEQANISKVTLFSGKVDFTIVGTEHTIEMKPSQELTFNAEKASVKVDEMQGVKWKEGNYEFTNVDLSSWIEIVGRIYNVKISLEHGQATKNLLNGRLRYNESLEEAIEKMCFSTGWRYRKENGEYIIFR